MNNWNFTGNLGKDAEVKYTPSGTAVCEFSVAVKSGYGEREKTNWVRCAMFGKKAEGQLPQYLKKGTQVAVSGELELQEWEGQNGKGAALSVSVQNIDLIGGNPNNQQAPQQYAQPPAQQQQYNPNQPPAPPQGQPMGAHQAAPQQVPQNQIPSGFDDNIPF
jgi:single-strand DNA-binding protein